MANAALLPINQFMGTSYAGYTITAYEVGTTTPKDIYTSSSGSGGASHDNPLTLNANGSTTLGIWGTGFYDILLKNTSGTTVFTWTNVSGGDATVSSSSSATAMNPSDNFVRNSQFSVWQNGTTTLTGKADATENSSKWFGLTQSGNYDASQLTTTALSTASSAIQLTNSHGSAQRIGLIQWTQKTAGDPIAANTIFGQVKVRPGTNQTLRIALLAWLDPNSTPTTDVVNNWASPTFTEGNFFISSANLEVIATGSVSGTTATWSSLSANGTVPSNCTRVGLFVWTDSTIASSDTVDVSAAAVYESTSALLWRPRDPDLENIITLGTNLTPIDTGTTVDFGSTNVIDLGSGSTITGPTSNTIAKWFVQEVNAVVTTNTSGTTVFPHDNTIPQNTEGVEIITLAITPKNANNILYIEAHTMVESSSATGYMGIALFQDSTAGALTAGCIGIDAADSVKPLYLKHRMVAGTTSATTFKIRVGNSAAGTTMINSDGAGNALYGGVANTYLTIREYTA